jgi:thiol:disulfide interchange protein DsbC
MSLMSKLLMSTVLATATLSATPSPNEAELISYLRSSVVQNPNVKINGLTILERTTHKDLDGWQVVLVSMHLSYNGKEINAPETMFIKDGLIAPQLVSLNKGINYRTEIKPSVPNSVYDDAHLLFGQKDAKHKILIFSDPQCPFCQDVVPNIFEKAKANPKTMAVYYYHLPLLNIHPVSDALTRIMHVAQHEGRVDVVQKLYSLKINAKETNLTTILSAVKEHTGYSVSAEAINKQSVKDALKADEKVASQLMVQGTPTIYIDGKLDRSRQAYRALVD